MGTSLVLELVAFCLAAFLFCRRDPGSERERKRFQAEKVPGTVQRSTVATAADIVFGVGDPLLEIVHLDAQSSAAADKHLDTLAYNSLLHRSYRVPVHSIVLLLRPQAEHANLTGSVQYAARPGRGRMDFGFEVIRLSTSHA